VLRCDGLVRRFGDRTAVDGVSLTIASGETYGLLGPNGAGKTTCIRMVCGLLRPDSGTVEIDGARIDPRAVRAKAGIGFVPQDVALYPDLTARENLRFFGRLYRLRGALLDERVDEVLHLIDLADRADDRVEAYSGGMQRRLNIGAGLLHRPRLLVLDEPTVGVDPQSRHATHYMEEAERICDRVGIIDQGRIIAEGTRRELVSQLEEHDRIELAASGPLDLLVAACRELDEVDDADASGGATVHLIAREGRRLLPRVLELADRAGVTVSSVEVTEPDLEAVFLRLTGTALRE
jgi:ABC-2 type transport system ATP-binding protein